MELTFEKALQALQEKVKNLEGGQLSLEDSLKAFEEGVGLIRFCQGHLEKADQKVSQLMQINSKGEPELKPFQTPE